MRFAAFALLLVIAGVCATPLSDVEVTQSRIYDLWVKDKIEKARNWMSNRDPFIVEKRDFNIVIISRQAEASGVIENLEIIGGSSIDIEECNYNILLGRLDVNIVHRGIRLSLGNAAVKLVYGDRRGEGVASGSLEIKDIRVKGNVLLKHDYDGRPWIYNINAELEVGSINADMKIVGSHKDYSETFNRFVNVRLPELSYQYKLEMNTVLGELIKLLVEYIRRD